MSAVYVYDGCCGMIPTRKSSIVTRRYGILHLTTPLIDQRVEIEVLKKVFSAVTHSGG